MKKTIILLSKQLSRFLYAMVILVNFIFIYGVYIMKFGKAIDREKMNKFRCIPMYNELKLINEKGK